MNKKVQRTIAIVVISVIVVSGLIFLIFGDKIIHEIRYRSDYKKFPDNLYMVVTTSRGERYEMDGDTLHLTYVEEEKTPIDVEVLSICGTLYDRNTNQEFNEYTIEKKFKNILIIAGESYVLEQKYKEREQVFKITIKVL